MDIAATNPAASDPAATDPGERGGPIAAGADTRHRPVGGGSGLVRSVLVGLGMGAAYGACLRAWMRLVSTDPEFSWGGTGYIVGVFAVLGGMAGLVSAGRRRGWGRRLLAARLVGIVLSLGCFVAAGLLMLPTVVPAALGWSRSDWPRLLRTALVLVGATAAVGVVMTLPDLALSRRFVATVLYLPLCAVEVALVARLYAPSRPASPGRLTAVVPALAGGATLAAGIVVLGVGR